MPTFYLFYLKMEKEHIVFLEKFKKMSLDIPSVIRPYVYSCFFYSACGVVRPIKSKCFPNGYVELVVHLDNSYFLFKNNKRKPLLNNYVIGLKNLNEPDDLICNVNHEKIAAMVMKFTSLGVREFLKLPLAALCGQVLELEDIWGLEGKELQSRLISSESYDDYAIIMNEFLLNMYKKVTLHNYFHIDHFIDTYDNERRGFYNVEKMASFFNMSYRTLHRKFIEEVGICPKNYLKILRFNKFCAILHKNLDLSIIDAAYYSGYYDLSHLNKEFNYVMGTSPARYLEACKRKLMVARVVKLED